MTFLKKYSNFIESNYPIRSAIPFMKELLNKEELKIISALKVLVMVPENIVF